MNYKRNLTIVIMLAAVLTLSLSGCASRSGYEGAAVGAGVGGVAGALLDGNNRWRGGVIGGALGAVLGGTLGEISDRAARQSAQTNRPVAYTGVDNHHRVVTEPVQRSNGCSLVKEKLYEDGVLVKETVREICP